MYVHPSAIYSTQFYKPRLRLVEGAGKPPKYFPTMATTVIEGKEQIGGNNHPELNAFEAIQKLKPTKR